MLRESVRTRVSFPPLCCLLPPFPDYSPPPPFSSYSLLYSQYHLRLTLPLVPGSKKNTLEVDPLVAVAISSTFLPPPRPIQSSSHSSSSSLSSALPGIGVLSSNDLPPSYLQVEDGWVSELVPEPKGGLDAKEP